MGKVKKPYKHSTTFYRNFKRKLDQSIQDHGKPNAPLQHNIKLTDDDQSTIVSVLIDPQEIHKRDNQPSITAANYCQEFSQSTLNPHTVEKVSDSSDDENGMLKTVRLYEDLKIWSIANKPTMSSLNDLLKMLNKHGFKLPKDSRSLLSTGDVNIKPIGQGNFWYNGVRKNLECLKEFNLSNISQIELIVNVDGMSLFNSTASEVWPISFAVYGMPQIKVMFAAIYYGTGKPPLEPFLRDFINEMQFISKEGIYIKGKKLHVKLKCFVCDTPARAFIKGTPYFNSGKSSCLKCTVEGKWDKKGRHMSYPMFQCPRRTNASFRNKIDEDHHVIDTPLVDLPIDMVEDFIVADSLHLLDLGIMRKCLISWCNGSFNFRTKLRGSEIGILNQMLESCEIYRPKEIQRNIRGVKYLKYWKGTEYRVMLLYLGVVVLKDILSKEVYEHYLLLNCAVTILSCKNYLVYIDVAKILLEEYLEGCINIYGSDSISSNFHNLCHVIDDVRKFGCLSGISSYRFENSLGELKSLVRSGKQPLTQIAHWVTRLCTNRMKADDRTQKSNISLKGCSGDGSYKKIYFQNVMLSDDGKNSWFLTKGSDIVKMQKVIGDNAGIYIIGIPLESKEDFYVTPFKSSKLNIYSSKSILCSQSTEMRLTNFPSRHYTALDIKCKLFHLRYKTTSVFFPLLHTIDMFSKM